MTLPKQVTLVEVGPRDGLQNESLFIPTDIKIKLVDALSQTGLTHIETGSFVSPKAIPQLADSDAVFQGISRKKRVHYSALVPNLQGLIRATNASVTHISVFLSASESFSQRNINCSIEESLQRLEDVIKQAKQQKLFVRAYISCVLGCPYEGNISADKVVELTNRLIAMDVDEISLGDTIGIGTAGHTQTLIKAVSSYVPLNKLAMHFHDTYGQAIANIFASLQCGVSIFDCSVAGLGGCPYAKGATGNVATEDVLYLLKGLNIETGVDIFKIMQVGLDISKQLGRKNQSKVSNAINSSH